VADEANFAVMGGSADVIAEVVGGGFSPSLGLNDAARLAVRALSSDGGQSAAPRVLGVDALEVAILDRNRAMPRKFRRIKGDRLAALLADGPEPADTAADATADTAADQT
jgi:proteasome alpha subunit